MSAISTDAVREGPTFAGTFWVQGALLRVVIGCCLFGLTFYQPLPMALLAAVIATDLFAFIWALIKFNNVAGTHLTETGRFWPVVFGFCFFFLAAVAMIISWWLLVSEALTYFLNPDGNVKGEATLANLGENRVWYGSAASAELHDLDWLQDRLPTDGSIQIKPLTA